MRLTMGELADVMMNFKFGHQAIIVSLDEIHSVIRAYTEAKPKIRELQDRLLAHFSQQNDKFFNRLKEIHKEDREKEKTIEFLVQDLKETKIKTLIFFDAHPADMGDLRPGNFPVEFAEFSQHIASRLKLEKEYLFPLLD